MTSTVVDGYTVNTVLNDMEYGIYEQVCSNRDGSYTIFLNARYDNKTLRNAYLHALDHIRNNDWENKDVQEIEAAAHSAPAPAPAEQPACPISQERIRLAIEQIDKERRNLKKRLDRIQRKYAKMTPAEIWAHNDRMLARYESRKDDPEYRGCW